MREKVVQEKSKNEIREPLKQKQEDTAAVRTLLRNSYQDYLKFRNDSVVPIAKRILNLTFPDISFSDTTGKVHSVSDFSRNDLLITYNYMYCEPCFFRVDTSLKYLHTKNVRIIALFSDRFQQDAPLQKNYGEDLVLGFINNETKDMISLTLGDSFAYYLNENRQVEFFDHPYLGVQESSWVEFLKMRNR